MPGHSGIYDGIKRRFPYNASLHIVGISFDLHNVHKNVSNMTQIIQYSIKISIFITKSLFALYEIVQWRKEKITAESIFMFVSPAYPRKDYMECVCLREMAANLNHLFIEG